MACDRCGHCRSLPQGTDRRARLLVEIAEAEALAERLRLEVRGIDGEGLLWSDDAYGGRRDSLGRRLNFQGADHRNGFRVLEQWDGSAPDTSVPRAERGCSAPSGCGLRHYARGLCRNHHARWIRHGHPDGMLGADGRPKPLWSDVEGPWPALPEPEPLFEMEAVPAERRPGRAWVTVPGSEKARRAQQRANAARRKARMVTPMAERRVDRLAVFERDGWVCGLCGGKVDPELRHPDPLSASLDHVLPLALGGLHEWGNVQCSHLRCNTAKGARLSEEETTPSP